jgi:hypothetical protein
MSRLRNPKWIAPLRDGGIFSDPPPAVAPEDGYVQHAHWPASKFLAEMAPHAPSEVAAIFAGIETDNMWVANDMLNAALAMPPQTASTMVPAVCYALQQRMLSIHFKAANELCALLAEGGEVDHAMALADVLFTPRFRNGQGKPVVEDEYWYKEGLKTNAPALVHQRPHEFLAKMCGWLETLVESSGYVDKQKGWDGSSVWRPAVEEHAQNRDYDLACALVGFVRQGFEDAIRADTLSFSDSLGILDKYRYLIFKRIRLHLINEFAEKHPELARQAMMDRRLFDDHEYKHEYAMLVGRRLPLLTTEERQVWFAWVDAGPDMSDFDESIRRNLGRDATEADRAGRIRYWKFERLHWVREHLDDEHQAFYEEMLTQEGEPDMADLNFRSTEPRWGYDSPLTVEELSAKTFPEAVETVSSWQPVPHRFREPDIKGLSVTFRQYVATDPVEFSKQANELVGRPAIYVREFISQMSQAVNGNQDIDVSAVLELCSWVVGRPVEERTTPEQRRDRDVDNNWQWTRDEISRFLRYVCEARVDDVPRFRLAELRARIWAIISTLCHDPARSYILRDDTKEDARTMDYVTKGINSSRGKAVEAALEYARWVALQIKEGTDEKRTTVPGGFDAMREAREVLDWQIDAENRSFEALAIIGLHLALIDWIDRSWLVANTDRLFDLAAFEKSPSMAHGWAAWNAFLVWVPPRVDYYGLFEEQYIYAVRQAAQVHLSGTPREQPMVRLGEHLMYYYGRGRLKLDDDSLMHPFLTTVNPDIRRHAFGFVGETLTGPADVPADILDRFARLWEIYWAGGGPQDAKEKPNAFSFGAWFASGRFPTDWALEQLEEFVAIAPILEPDDSVVEQLSKIAPTDPLRCTRILDRMIRGDQEGWRIHGWMEAARQVLKTAMSAGGEARSTAESLIDFLGRRGFIEFGTLLPQ